MKVTWIIFIMAIVAFSGVSGQLNLRNIQSRRLALYFIFTMLDRHRLRKLVMTLQPTILQLMMLLMTLLRMILRPMLLLPMTLQRMIDVPYDDIFKLEPLPNTNRLVIQKPADLCTMVQLGNV